MPLKPDVSLQYRLERWSYILIWTVAAIALLALAGWVFKIPFLYQPFSDAGSMNPVSAVCFIFISLIFWKGLGSKRILSLVLAIALCTTGLIKLGDILTGAGWKFDQLLTEISGQNSLANPMAMTSAINFLLCGIAVILFISRKRSYFSPAQALSVFVILFGWFSLLGYVYRAGPSNTSAFIFMAPHTAICFLLAGLALLFAFPGKGVMRHFTSVYSGSLTAKLLMPAAVILPSALGLLRLHGSRTGAYRAELGVALFTLAVIILFVFLSYSIARLLNRRDLLTQQAEDTLRKNEEEVTAIFRTAPEAVLVVDARGQIIKWNPVAAQMLSLPGRSDIVSDFSLAIAPNHREEFITWRDRYVIAPHNEQAVRMIELKMINGAGEHRDVELRMAVLSVSHAQHFVVFIRDITHQRQTDQRLMSFNQELARQVAEKTKELNEIFERLTDGFIALDKDFRYTYINRKAGEMIHHDPASLIGKNVWEVFPEAIDSATFIAFQQALKEQRYIINTDYFEPLHLWQENHIYPTQGGLSVFIRDISKRKLAEIALQESESRYRTIIEEAGDAVLVLDKDGQHYIEANRKAAELLGYSVEELLRISPYSLIFPDDNMPTPFDKMDAGESVRIERTLRKKNGQGVAVETSARKMPNGNYIAFVRDVSERKRFEQALKASEEKYKLLFESNPLPMWMLSLPEYRVLDVNEAALRQYGYSREEFLALDISCIRPEEDRQRFRAVTNTNFRGEHHAGIWRHQRKNGSVLHADVVTHDIHYGGQPARFVLANNVTERYIAEEKLKESYESIRNLTEHLQNIREEERTHIAREIHDELGQQLTVLKMDIAWLNRKIGPDNDPAKDKIRELLETVDKTVKTVRRISAELRPSLLDDLGLIPAMDWHVEEFEKRFAIRTSFSRPEEGWQLSDTAKISLFRIFQESLTNVARHAGAMHVEIVLEEKDNRINLVITDDGVGFDEKNAVKKTLGILGMKERTRMIGGEYTISGSPGKGTTVFVSVPIVADHK